MNLITESYVTQQTRWPQSGSHILAQFDDSSIVVYQAYRPFIGNFAARHGHFGGDFQFSRMSWIKPNFLWMMYRSGWGTKPDQQVTLAIRIKREGFENILSAAVHSSFVPEVYKNSQDWKEKLSSSAVRLQWDPDHDPGGNKMERRAIQLGLSGEFLRRYVQEWPIEIEDISHFVASERENLERHRLEKLRTPKEDVYPITDEDILRRLQISADQG